jgi:hypothetical protein
MIERLNEVERRLNALMQALKSNEGRLAAVEQSNWQRAGMGFPWQNSGGQVAKATSLITARAGTTYGTGTAKFQSDDGSDLGNNGAEYAVKSILDMAILEDSYLLLMLCSGSWWVVSAGSCEDLV